MYWILPTVLDTREKLLSLYWSSSSYLPCSPLLFIGLLYPISSVDAWVTLPRGIVREFLPLETFELV